MKPACRLSPLGAAEKTAAIDVWEASVRATHGFVRPSDIPLFRRQLESADFGLWTMLAARDAHDRIAGFMGIKGQNLDMLFVHPDHFGQGFGHALLQCAIQEYGVRSLEVNEQNTQALAFYQKHGFGIASRSELDGNGKPYPILHMELTTNSTD